MKHRRALRLQERLVVAAGKPDDRFCPCRRTVGIAAGVAPQDDTCLVRKLARKGPVDPDESVTNELADLCIVQRAQLVLTASHDVLPSRRQMAFRISRSIHIAPRFHRPPPRRTDSAQIRDMAVQGGAIQEGAIQRAARSRMHLCVERC
jgi:hypothetical protein